MPHQLLIPDSELSPGRGQIRFPWPCNGICEVIVSRCSLHSYSCWQGNNHHWELALLQARKSHTSPMISLNNRSLCYLVVSIQESCNL